MKREPEDAYHCALFGERRAPSPCPSVAPCLTGAPWAVIDSFGASSGTPARARNEVLCGRADHHRAGQRFSGWLPLASVQYSASSGETGAAAAAGFLLLPQAEV
ncbi:hypothetical protein HEK131_30690 [Streptomyces seoulensis]|nr:hypothetical protein HEK131_30690 [Streptomyces seoulensis]